MIKKRELLSKIGVLFSIAYLLLVLLGIFIGILSAWGGPRPNFVYFIILPWFYLFNSFSSWFDLSEWLGPLLLYVLPIIINVILFYYIGLFLEYYTFFHKRDAIRNKYQDSAIFLFIILSAIPAPL